jgi:CRP-like cAMP-binding protein
MSGATYLPDHPGEIFAQLFPQLSPEALSSLEREASLEEHDAQVTLCHEGRVEDRFYVVVDGRVDVYKVLEGQMMFVCHLTRGAHFGDIALMLDVPRTATIITAGPTRVWNISRAALGRFLQSEPQVVVALLQLIVRRLLAQEEKHLVEIARLKKRDVPPARIFLSYARTDQEFVTRLANNLRQEQIDVWLDVYRIEAGKSWARQIAQALDTCEVMLLVLSPATVASDNAEDEWNYFLDHKKPVIVVRLAPCKTPYRLQKLEYINFHETDYDQSLARLAATLNTLN